MILLEALGAYALVGAVVSLPFLAGGITRVLEYGEHVSLPARFLFPGSVVFWPLILVHWRRAPR